MTRSTPTSSSTALAADAREQWLALGGDPATLELAAERAEYELPARAATRPT